MKILVVGGGGREHALCWKIAKSPLVEQLWCAPGNAGIADVADCVAIAADDVPALVDFSIENAVDMVVIGPEAPLVKGLGDRLRAIGIAVFGPDAAAAQVEGSKAFTKALCDRANIPTARYGTFTDPASAKAFLDGLEPPYVLKADGLAAGKGVVIPETREEAEAEIDDMMSGRFGDASRTLVIEEFLNGEEASVFALCDGNTAIPLTAAQDHKRAHDGDQGPNTGGMGAYSPTPIAGNAIIRETMDRIILPAVKTLKAEGMPYSGVLYAGLMIGKDGPKLIEFNARFGDPECQILMMRMLSDIVPYLKACADGKIDQMPPISWHASAAVTVVLAAKGYPETYKKGTEIRGVDAANELAQVVVFHAGTKRSDDGHLLANGGRVLNVTAMGSSYRAAIDRAYEAVDLIDWADGFCRRDIGWRALEHSG
ncbi:phosphoribosylamine--glycine ligase [Hyphobacterium sp. HN65]|uniref:Phosphoribosylamine--glycine ligase n=1 Tax=Hyphobacterium lacteum TaxID=3116575 RepID=A0ABU7LN61_9PROT|nr:phosphoribosylamine--glycine ligase [Hyphobacterium sp. HN65]MEE2525355.1 phosphoribosylamine--glycine ligase [Hyphobacterium sp. HN65]